MREHGIKGVTRRRRRNLTKPDKGAAAVPDLIRRDFTAPMPGLRLTGDISCFPTGEGWLYLATVPDLCSKELIGYAIAPHMRAGPAVEAITAAHRTGLVAGNAIMHTDRSRIRSTTRQRTGTLYSTWRSARAPAAPDHVSTAPQPSRSSNAWQERMSTAA
jgi:transposase InsO family protein